jgi:hypothetical protein
MKTKILFAAALIMALACASYSQSKSKTKKKTIAAPNTIVKNLYAAEKAGTGPFFQTKSRARVDKYFTKELADLIWKDAVASQGEVGALDGDPLYNAQDMEITNFKIGKPEYGEGNLNVADVAVSFKNFGQEKTVLFRLERGKNKTWKISNILYPSDGGSLKEILSSS